MGLALESNHLNILMKCAIYHVHRRGFASSRVCRVIGVWHITLVAGSCFLPSSAHLGMAAVRCRTYIPQDRIRFCLHGKAHQIDAMCCSVLEQRTVFLSNAGKYFRLSLLRRPFVSCCPASLDYAAWPESSSRSFKAPAWREAAFLQGICAVSKCYGHVAAAKSATS